MRFAKMVGPEWTLFATCGLDFASCVFKMQRVNVSEPNGRTD